MFEKIKSIALSLILLLNMFGATQALTLDIFPVGNDFVPTQTPVSSASRQTVKSTARSRASRTSRTRKVSPVKKAGDSATSKPKSARKNEPVKNASKGKNANSSRPTSHGKTNIAKVGKPTKANRNSAHAVEIDKRLRTLKVVYSKRTGGGKLHITSLRRTPARQAKAMHKNLTTYGIRHVERTYRRKAAVREIIAAYKPNRRRPQKAVREMTKVIENQIRRGVFISNHLLGHAVDIRSRGRNGARLRILREIARSIGAKVLVEKNHFHLELI